MKANYTEGKIVPLMLKTAVAMLASTLAMCGYNIADTFYVGQLGKAPLAAMGFTFPVVMLLGCIFRGVSGGAMTTMAHAIGSNEQKDATRLVSCGVLLMAILSCVLAAIGICTANRVYPLMGAKGETLVCLKQYMAIWFFGCITASMAMMGNDLLIGAGKPRLASGMNIIGMLLNVYLDPVFIFGGREAGDFLAQHFFAGNSTAAGCLNVIFFPFRAVSPMGIGGAALATVISQAVSALVILAVLWKVDLLSFQRYSLKELFSSWKKIVHYAIPATLGMLLFPMTHYVVTWVTSSFGDATVAGIAAGSRLETVAFIAPMAFGIPLMSVIAQNYGAKLYSRVRFAFHFSSIVAFSFLLLAAVVFFFGAPYIVPIMTPDKEVQTKMLLYMHILPWGFGILELTRYSGFLLTGCGHPTKDAILKAVRMLCILLPCVGLTYYFHWEPGVFFSRLTTDVCGGLICLGVALHTLAKLPKTDGVDPEEAPAVK